MNFFTARAFGDRLGIAGSFMGFHIGVILELLPSLLLYLCAIAGALLTIIFWRRV